MALLVIMPKQGQSVESCIIGSISRKKGELVKKGETLSDDNLAVKRPGTGITPMRWEEVIGTKAIKDYQPDEQIQL